VKTGGCLVSKYGLKRSAELKAAHHFTYSFDDTRAEVYARDLSVVKGAYHFDIAGKLWEIRDLVLNMGGLHNIENAVAAITVAKHLGISDEKIRAAVNDFKGVKRRFEYIIKTDEQVLIDDYAHHPKELEALIQGVRSIYREKLTVIFQPHLYTRTNDLADEFAASLDLADEVILLPIYPARELPIEGVESEMIIERMKLENKKVMSKEAMQEWLAVSKPTLLVMAGAGDIDVLVEPVKNILLN
jgi:UDP-N-acetylmuramate--alanine ligase